MTYDRILLGRKLFFDPVLSADSSISCGSCHNPRFAFADSSAFSRGAHGQAGTRNTPSLYNVAWYPYFFAEGGVPTLELVSVAPIQTDVEMGFNLAKAVHRLEADEAYVRLFQKAYDTLPSTYTLVRALGAYQRSLVSADAPYDRYTRGDSLALTAEAKHGMALFFSDTLGCARCHSGFLFTDFGFHNVGLLSGADVGRYRLTSVPSDSGKFKTPSLRNVALTAPYMHNGSLTDLPAVLDFYAAGGGADAHKDKRMNPFHLSETDKRALLAFLQSLTDSVAWNTYNSVPLEE